MMAMICCAVTPCLAVSMTSTAVVSGVGMLGTPEAAPDCVCCGMINFLLSKIRASDMALVLLLTDRGCDRLQSRIRTGDSTPIVLPGSHFEESLECSWVQRS